jgi:hypothetical protein
MQETLSSLQEEQRAGAPFEEQLFLSSSTKHYWQSLMPKQASVSCMRSSRRTHSKHCSRSDMAGLQDIEPKQFDILSRKVCKDGPARQNIAAVQAGNAGRARTGEPSAK